MPPAHLPSDRARLLKSGFDFDIFLCYIKSAVKIKTIPPDSELAKYIQKLRELKPYLQKRFKVSEIGIFGSLVRDAQKADSDVDILVKFSEPIGLEFFDCVEFLEGRLGRRVDLVSYEALSPYIKPFIEQEVIFV